MAQCHGFQNRSVKRKCGDVSFSAIFNLEDLLNNMYSLKKGVNKPRSLGLLHLKDPRAFGEKNAPTFPL